MFQMFKFNIVYIIQYDFCSSEKELLTKVSRLEQERKVSFSSAVCLHILCYILYVIHWVTELFFFFFFFSIIGMNDITIINVKKTN